MCPFYDTICDASFTTYALTHWGRDRARGRFELPWLIKRQTHDTAAAVGLGDRGLVRPGMKADLNAARAALKEAGYADQKVVIINPTDVPTIGPLGDITNDMLKKIGINVELQATDWGSVRG